MAKLVLKSEIVHRPWKEIVAAAKDGPHSSIAYDFPDNLATIPIPDIIDTFQWVLGETTADAVVKDALLPLWLHGLVMQVAKFRLAALTPLIAPGMRFRWLLFETWEKRFKDHEVWPESWSHLVRKDGRPCPDREAKLLRMLDYFIAHKINNRRDAASYRPGNLHDRWGWRLTTSDASIAEILAEKEAEISLADWKTYPPFFPGDMSTIALNKPPRRAY